MTYEEAINILVEIDKSIQPYSKWWRWGFKKALKVAIEALKKQIPKNPKLANNIYKQKCYWCPSCSHYFMERYAEDWFNELMLKAMSHQNAYCPNCGQAIDWSDVCD